MSTLEEVNAVLDAVLNLGGRARSFTKHTPLLGGVPEFDSMSIVAVITNIEEYFDIQIDDDEVTAETFETVGSLVDMVECKLANTSQAE